MNKSMVLVLDLFSSVLELAWELAKLIITVIAIMIGTRAIIDLIKHN